MADYKDTIQNRISIRTYTDTPVGDSVLNELSGFIGANSRGPFGSMVRILIADTGVIPREEMRSYGTYGIIRGARVYLIGITEKGSFPEDFGYVFEKVILKATEMGLGTCWLGGTFKRNGFVSASDVKDNELLYAVSPLGYAAGRRSIADRTVRTLARSSTRLPFERLFFEGEDLSSVQEDTSPVLKYILEMVRLGPSASNRQPWRIVRINNTFHFYLSRTSGYARGLEILDAADLQRSDIGIAMCHFETALQSGEAAGRFPGRWMKENPELNCPFEYIASWKS